MPVIQPAELWQETGPLGQVRARSCCDQGPPRARLRRSVRRTRKSITDIVRKEIRSYRQLPVNLYQIQTKFRDEIRPRFGVMRAREFMMKDAYSFDVDRRRADEELPGDVRRLRAHLHAAGARVPRGRGRHRARSAASRRTSSRCSPIPARTRSRGQPASRLRGERRAGGSARARDRARLRPPKRWRRCPRPDQSTCEEVTQLLRPAACAHA